MKELSNPGDLGLRKGVDESILGVLCCFQIPHTANTNYAKWNIFSYVLTGHTQQIAIRGVMHKVPERFLRPVRCYKYSPRHIDRTPQF